MTTLQMKDAFLCTIQNNKIKNSSKKLGSKKIQWRRYGVQSGTNLVYSECLDTERPKSERKAVSFSDRLLVILNQTAKHWNSELRLNKT